MAEYPPLIHLDEKTKTNLIFYLNTELTNHYMEKGKFQDDLLDMQHSYWAEPVEDFGVDLATGVNVNPNDILRGGAKVVIPLNAIAVEAIHARAMQTIFGLGQLISAKAVSSDWQNAVQPVEKFLDRELLTGVKVRRPVNDAILEVEKFGTGVLKSGYQRLIKTAVREVDGKRKVEDVVVREGATLHAVPISRFLMPYSSLQTQTSAWCGEEHSWTPHEIWLQEKAGLFYDGIYEKIKASVSQTGTLDERKFERSQEELEKHEIVMPDRINFTEIWCAWNTDDDPKNQQKETVVYYHRDTQTIMGMRYNWYDDLRRPYRNGVYFPIEHRWYGMGIIKQNNQFQEEVTIRHRQQLDNATLANMRMIKVSKLSGIAPDEPLYAGKIWFLDDMDHMDTVQLGEIYPSAYNSEQSTLQYSNQRTGVTELTTGQPQAGTPVTASDILARIQEGNKKFGFVFANMKEFVDEAFMDVACEIQQFGPRDVKYYDTAEDGDLVEKFFSMPQSYIRDGLLIELKAAGQLENKLIDRQNFMQLAQAYEKYITGNLQLAEVTKDPNLISMIVQKGMAGSTELMRQFFQSFDLRNIDRMLLGGDNQIISGGAGGAALPGQNAGMVNPSQAGSQLSGIGL